MGYKAEVIKAMELLASNPKTLFVGQTVIYPSGPVYGTLLTIPKERKIEVPVFEDTQMGMCIGLSLIGYIPICVFPRFDFLICATNQLVNHLDKVEELSTGRFKPKVIIRVLVGATEPLNPGIQHSSDYTAGLEDMLKSIEVIKLDHERKVVLGYKKALESDKSTVLVEYAEKGLSQP